MVGKTGVRQFAFLAIQQMPRGMRIVLRDLYRKVESIFPEQCSSRGDLPSEPRYENDIRWAIRDAKDHGLIKHTGKRGEWQRI
jgi:hypothetical protein